MGSITSNENNIVDIEDQGSFEQHPVINSICHDSPSITSRLPCPPSSLPYNYDDIAKTYNSISLCTPPSLISSIHRIHAKCQFQPNKTFFHHHSKQIQRLDSTQFQRYCSLNFHVDGGANCGSIKDKSLFYFYIKGSGAITTVAGTKVQSQGWGAILVKVDTNVYLVGPLYYFPNHPQNTLSPSILLNYNNFIEATVRTNRNFELVTPNSKTPCTIPFRIHNDLDFATFEIMSIQPSTHHIIANSAHHPNIVLRRSSRIAKQIEKTSIPTIPSNK